MDSDIFFSICSKQMIDTMSATDSTYRYQIKLEDILSNGNSLFMLKNRQTFIFILIMNEN